MAEENKIIRLADVGELEADLKKDLAEEEAKGRAADVLYCESISDELSDLGNLPTIDPESLRGHAKWEKPENLAFIIVDGLKADYPALKEACMELRQMMMQKTAGQRKDKPKDLSWDNLERVKVTIICEAMALVLSGEYEEAGA